MTSERNFHDLKKDSFETGEKFTTLLQVISNPNVLFVVQMEIVNIYSRNSNHKVNRNTCWLTGTCENIWWSFCLFSNNDNHLWKHRHKKVEINDFYDFDLCFNVVKANTFQRIVRSSHRQVHIYLT